MTLSIIGTAKNFVFNEKLKNAFKIGLMKATKYFVRYKILIMTEGRDIEIARLAGDAINDDLHAYKHVKLIGIANFEKLAVKEKLIYTNDGMFKNVFNICDLAGYIYY